MSGDIKIEEFENMMILCFNSIDDKYSSLSIIDSKKAELSSSGMNIRLDEHIYHEVFDSKKECNFTNDALMTFLIKRDGVFNDIGFSSYLREYREEEALALEGDNKINKQMIEYARGGDFIKVFEQLKLGANPTFFTKESGMFNMYSVFDFAIYHKVSSVFSELIRFGVEPRCKKIWKSLYQGGGEKASELVGDIISSGIDLNKNGSALLTECIEHLDFNNINSLLKNESFKISHEHLKSVLSIGMHRNNIDAVLSVIEGGVLPTPDDVSNAIKDGYSALIKIIINEIGYPVTNNPEFMLAAASSIRGEEMIKILSEAGLGKERYVNSDGDNAILVSVKEGRPEYFLLLSAIYSKSGGIINNNGDNAITTAIKRNYTDMVKAVCQSGAELNEHNREGLTPLSLATKLGSNDIIKILLEYGADINYKNDKGTTALMAACLTREVDGVKTLIEQGADVNIRNKNGMTCLTAALIQKTDVPAIVELIINAGYDLDTTHTLKGVEIRSIDLAQQKKKYQSIRILTKGPI